MIERARLQALNDADPRRGRYVLYWMQQTQRADGNPALEHAVREANRLGLPAVVGFGLMDDYPEANERHYAFMLEGLSEVDRELRQRGLAFVVRHGSPDDVALQLAKDAALVVVDRGYMRHQRQWRRRVAGEADCAVVQVEGDVVVPVERVSDKQEFAARTLRPKIHKLRDEFIGGLGRTEPDKRSLRLRGLKSDFDISDVDGTLRKLDLDRSVKRVARFRGGTSEALRRLTDFLRGDLDGYADERNEPADQRSSGLSPYLHFGQVSPVEVARRVSQAKGPRKKDREAFLEELIVRRELAANFVSYCADYDKFACLPDWARKTLDEHADDEREHVYTRRQLEQAETHDEYWNAAMREMTETGFMQNYMRMYWGKKILEWTRTPEYAYRTALYLNNKYFLDGRDANSYANVAWCFGLHDRPWTERPIFGKVRYMNARGLERKFDMQRYLDCVAELARREREAG